MKPLFDGKVEGGKLTLYDKHGFQTHVKSFEGCPVLVSIEKFKRNRSNPQNKYLWGVCYKLISDHTGYDVDEVHDMMKLKFLPKHIDIVDKETGEVKETHTIPGRSSKLTTIEFNEYVENIQRWSSQFLSLVIPDPGQVV